ncbi:MAG: hypothetical protein LKK00_09885 [Intestinimonas sp.]|jgi:hypothetical protein|nr:hypothetical protein [Intestinimonas sp.]
MSEELIAIMFQFTRREYIRGTRLYLRKSHTVSWIQLLILMVAAVAVGILFRIVGGTLLNLFVAVLLLLVTGYGCILYLWQPGRSFDRSSELAQQVRIVFSREDIGWQDAKAAQLIDWNVEKFWCCREFYFLIPKHGAYLMLPSRVFSSEEARRNFERLVREANPNAVCRDYR